MALFKDQIKALARSHGFDAVAICDVREPWSAGDGLREFLESNHHGTMDWLETTKERRSHPNKMWDGAVSAIMLGVNYGPSQDPLEALKNKENGVISVYAQNDDYHEIIKKRLKALAGEIHRKLSCEVKVFVDTAPLMEKPLAQLAGLGWQGKHTNLVSREFGSWLFLGSVLVAQELEYDAPEIDSCGTCTKCIDICPTGAIISPYKIDARKCISYLTIEHDGDIEPELMAKMGNRIYGCDDCLSVCPWNKFATPTSDNAFLPRSAASAPLLSELTALNDARFREIFAKSPIKRIGINKFLRNVAIAIGNSGDTKLITSARTLANNDNPMVKNAANWALSKQTAK
jgi:epoxyqueuosine reductase